MFVDPVLGAPLGLYIHDDVVDRASLVQLVSSNGGDVSPSPTEVPYILIDPNQPSSQLLCEQYAGKKGKLVLDARWIRECVRSQTLLLYHNNWGGCKLPAPHAVSAQPQQVTSPSAPTPQPQQHDQFQLDQTSPSAMQLMYPVTPGKTPAAQGGLWQSPTSFSTTSWVTSPSQNFYHDPQSLAQAYRPVIQNIDVSSTSPMESPEVHTFADTSIDSTRGSRGRTTRGRRRQRTPPPQPAQPSSLIIPRSRATARSPSPPSRVVKSIYGGNLFTAEDVLYLRKYIEYCQDKGLALSLRQICEKVAVKAPHHSFFSWRRYCNKHQIRLGGYAMHDSALVDSEDDEEQDAQPTPDPVPTAVRRPDIEDMSSRERSPTPPRALYRSTTGKGVAFTQEDIRFLVRFLEYRKSQGTIDMVAFWKDVATKAPHHSRASWMKFWRRHKHELNHTEGDDPLPAPPCKKMRYDKEDDILLARFFATKPQGISDKIFQSFAIQHPHHPWKGWQEHHRIHRSKIDELITRLQAGESLET